VLKNGVLSEEREPALKTDSPLNLSPAQFLEFTMERFAQWFKYFPFQSLAVSGGADSRLLLATLQQYPTETSFSIHSRCHPQLTPGQDADVLIAKQAVSALQKEHLVQMSEVAPSAYLSQESPAVAPVMSGLYGGELLGAEVIQLVSPVRIQKEKENSFADSISTCAQMFITDFYGGAWGICSLHHNLTVTPYWDSYFVGALLQTPTSVIKEYSLLSKMYEHLPANLRDLPFVSVFTDYQPQWKKNFPGVNPKSLSTTVVGPPLPSSWLKYKRELTEDIYQVRGGALRACLMTFYDISEDELLSLL
jgi:hypothetical protein